MKNSGRNTPPKMPNARKEVEAMDAYKAPLEGRRNMLRLDFNENTIGPSKSVIDALKKIPADQISIYPEYTGVRESFIENITNQNSNIPILSINNIGIFNGVDAAINAIFHAYGSKGTQLLTTSPTFGYYAPCAQMQGMEIISIPYTRNDFTFPFEKIRTTLIRNKPKLLFICNPNNPTGTILSPKKILELAHLTPETLIVIDELYEAFMKESILPNVNLEQTPNIVILRSLSKTAGLAGLRIGFAIGHSDVINLISRVTGPYDINSFAIAAALAALKDQEYIDAYVSEVLSAKKWIQNKLINKEVKHHIDGGNYFLLWPRLEVSKVEQLLKRSGILVRNMGGKPLIDGSLRVSVGTIEQMNEFWQAFKKIDVL